MKKLIMLSCALLLCVFLNAQTKANQLNTSINNLAQQLKTDPNNPLKIDNQFLNQLATAVPDGSLKNKLLQYSTQLGTDKNLSYRQVYWDVLQTLNSNPQNAKLAQFAQTQQSLDLLINKSKFVVNALKGDLNLVQATTFLSDPQFLTSLSKLTGAKTALNISSGLGAVVNFMNQVNENKQRIKDYTSYVEMSNMMVYPETDEQLGTALIDAYVGINYNVITPMYRYEFKNGSALYVEDEILKFVNSAGTIKKPLVKAAPRNDLASKKDVPSAYTSIYISADESYFIIQPGNKKYEGLLEKDRHHVLNSNSGEEVAKFKELYMGYTDTQEKLEDNNLTKWICYENGFGAPVGFSKSILKPGDKKEKFGNLLKLPKESGFLIADKMRDKKFGTFLKSFSVHETPKLFVSLVSGYDAVFNANRAANAGFAASMLAGKEVQVNSDPADPNSVIYGSTNYGTFLYVTNIENTIQNTNVLHNKFTCIANNSKGIFYAIAADGSIGTFDGSQITNPEDIVTKLSSITGKPVVTAYNFIEKRDPKLFNVETFTPSARFPELMITPDEQHLIYTIKDELFIINANNLSRVKKYKLTFQIVNSIFGKENGEYTLHLYGTNEFMITIAKKYSINKLAADYTSAKSLPIKEEKAVSKNNLKTTKKVTTPTKTTKATPTSLGDEIQKLKKLYDDGVLSKDEYEKAKKKLLDN